MQPGVERAGTSGSRRAVGWGPGRALGGPGWWAWTPESHGGGWMAGPWFRDPGGILLAPSLPLVGVGGRDRKGCGTTPGLNVSGLRQSGVWYRLRVSASDPNPAPQLPQEATWCPATWYLAT